MRSLWTAFRVLTFFRWPASFTATTEEIGKSASFFPLVGFCLGLILVFVNWLLDPYLASEIVSVLLVAVLIAMTRARHLDGLKNTFDGLGEDGWVDNGPAIRERRVRIVGLVVVLVVVALKFRAIEVMGETRAQGLLLAPMLGRWAMVILAYGSESGDEGIGLVRAVHLLFATASALFLVIVFAGELGLWIALWMSLFAILSRGYFQRRPGGLTGDRLGAVEEISETFALLLFASL